MEVMKHFYRLSGLIQAMLIFWMIHPAMAEGRVLEYKPLDFGLQVAGIQDSEIECLTRNIYFEAAIWAGYMRMILKDYSEEQKLKWLDVTQAQQCYNDKKLGCSSKWFFCQQKAKSPEPQRVPKSCSSKLVPRCLKPLKEPKHPKS